MFVAKNGPGILRSGRSADVPGKDRDKASRWGDRVNSETAGEISCPMMEMVRGLRNEIPDSAREKPLLSCHHH